MLVYAIDRLGGPEAQTDLEVLGRLALPVVAPLLTLGTDGCCRVNNTKYVAFPLVSTTLGKANVAVFPCAWMMVAVVPQWVRILP